jgi:3-O-alpha-D-mannopyranosyl-alpha-D-mannopyranose xylosylphosphotransferase
MIPILPITDTWQTADFSLDQVISDTEGPGPVNLRRYAVRLLSRYLYVSGMSAKSEWVLMTGRSKAEFHMINNPDHAKRILDAIDSETAMLGLNDNIERDADEAKEVMTDWFQQRWPNRTMWERV